MAESRTDTGGRNDLLVDASRCLKMRFSDSSCRRCADICPKKALYLDGVLAVNPKHCSGCLLCTTFCPTGALELSGDFSACLSQLSRVTEPVLGCIRTKENSNTALACLGGLSEEHLLALSHSLSGKLTLNLTGCGDCPNNTMVPHLRQRLAILSGGALLDGGCGIVIAESAKDIHFRDESIDRRGFFKSLRSSLFQGAAVILSAGNEQAERRTEYAGKRLPVRRELLNWTVARLSPELRLLVNGRFDHLIAISGNCTACQGCVAVCPTGALLTDSPDDQPRFDQQRCTGCGLCAEFCLDGAVKLDSE